MDEQYFDFTLWIIQVYETRLEYLLLHELRNKDLNIYIKLVN